MGGLGGLGFLGGWGVGERWGVERRGEEYDMGFYGVMAEKADVGASNLSRSFSRQIVWA